jgi:hypothetical protein
VTCSLPLEMVPAGCGVVYMGTGAEHNEQAAFLETQYVLFFLVFCVCFCFRGWSMSDCCTFLIKGDKEAYLACWNGYRGACRTLESASYYAGDA